jgi:hypothetical protein
MDWNENEHFVRVFMKMSVLKPKTGSINSGTVEVDTVRLETSHTDAGVLKKLSLAGIAKLSRLKYS